MQSIQNMQLGTITQTGKPRCIVYVDGYNWYHAVFKHHPEWKWLNIESFFRALRPDDDIVAVKLFSAMVTDAAGRERQEAYFNALKTLPKVKLILGKFQPREVFCRAHCGQMYIVQDEKKTDVNMAVEMISDAIDGCADSVCAVTGDSDIQPAVEWLTKRYPKIGILVYVPCLPNQRRDRRTDYYSNKGLKVECGFLPLANLADHQLKPAIRCADGKFVVRPTSWQAPQSSQQH